MAFGKMDSRVIALLDVEENDLLRGEVKEKAELWSESRAKLDEIIGLANAKELIDDATIEQLGKACDRFLRTEGLRQRAARQVDYREPRPVDEDEDTFFNPTMMERQMKTSLQTFVESSNGFLDFTMGYAGLMAGFQFLGIETSQQGEGFSDLENMSQFLLVISFILNVCAVAMVMSFKANVQTHLRLAANDYVEIWPEIYHNKVFQHMTKPLMISIVSTYVMAISIVIVAYAHFERWQFWVIVAAVLVVGVLGFAVPRYVNVREEYKDIMDRVDRYYQPWFWVRDGRNKTRWRRLTEQEAVHRLKEARKASTTCSSGNPSAPESKRVEIR